MTESTNQQEAVNPYFAPKPPGEKDYIIECGEIMLRYGLKDAVNKYYITNPTIFNAKGKVASVQRFALNTYWRDQFLWLSNSSETKVDTFDIRQYLNMTGDHDLWLKNFERIVVPFIIHYKLPTALPAYF